MLAQLKTALDEKGEIFAALFELADDELVGALCALGKKAHLVLANASVTKTKEETKDNDKWQAPKLAAQRRELEFWGV